MVRGSVEEGSVQQPVVPIFTEHDGLTQWTEFW